MLQCSHKSLMFVTLPHRRNFSSCAGLICTGCRSTSMSYLKLLYLLAKLTGQQPHLLQPYQSSYYMLFTVPDNNFNQIHLLKTWTELLATAHLSSHSLKFASLNILNAILNPIFYQFTQLAVIAFHPPCGYRYLGVIVLHSVCTINLLHYY